MATLEFKATVLSNGLIAVPPEIAAQIPAGEEIGVTLVWDDSLHALGRKLIDESCAAENSVYDSLA
jgi:hypothetical protein